MVIKEIKKIIHNKKGGGLIWLLVMIMAFVGVSALVLDIGNLYIKSKKIKYAVNRSVKAGTLAIQEGEELANGNFLIDETQAKENFKLILAHNLGLNEVTLDPLDRSLVDSKPVIKELEVENTTPMSYYSETLKRDFQLENPSVVAVLEFKIRGVFLQKTLRVSKLSSSQLTSIYD